MQAVKTLARSAPTSFARSARLSSRAYSPVVARSWMPITSIAPQSLARFSTSKPKLSANEELVEKLKSELSYEQEVLAEQSDNTSIKEYLDGSSYQLEDTTGSEEVHLVRTYGDEQIKVSFSTESFSNPDADVDPSSDPAMFDEDAEGRQPKIRQAPEDEIENEEYDESPANYQVQVSVQISRQGRGALVLGCFLDQDARFNIEHVAFFPTLEMAEGKTAEHELSKRNVYTGPPFEELDEGLQSLFDEYLRERGIDESMGIFIPSYIERKESEEYMRWMQNISKFVE
ncbi:mitochondrial glyco protein [Myriangium duriaei CBS 260.36]|uniref:Mitochondrial glyco protein n=1 Tax=Myriangium duriaei CBS 260.36 TaxID=1168546 RepID=A0A9P4MIK4_9PEZI|nr:mitochondrial glyco protein [Myriangium duriaei CBS 260.36]